jgi:hypothetical protein
MRIGLQVPPGPGTIKHVKSIFARDVQLFGQPVRLLGAARPVVQDVTKAALPEVPPPSPARETPGFKAAPYPGKSPFGSSCPVCH